MHEKSDLYLSLSKFGIRLGFYVYDEWIFVKIFFESAYFTLKKIFSKNFVFLSGHLITRHTINNISRYQNVELIGAPYQTPLNSRRSGNLKSSGDLIIRIQANPGTGTRIPRETTSNFSTALMMSVLLCFLPSNTSSTTKTKLSSVP